MAIMVKLRKNRNSEIADGGHNAQLVNVESGLKTTYGEKIKWTFNIEDENENVHILTGLTSQYSAPASKAKMAKWIEIMLGDFEAPEDFDIEQLVGTVVQVQVETNGKGYSNVVDVLELIDNSNSFFASRGSKEETEPSPF